MSFLMSCLLYTSDIDLAKEVTSRLGVELVLQPIAWDSKELELSGKNIDVYKRQPHRSWKICTPI